MTIIKNGCGKGYGLSIGVWHVGVVPKIIEATINLVCIYGAIVIFMQLI